MNDEKKYSEREMVQAKRAEFVEGIWAAHSDQMTCRREQRAHGLYGWEDGRALLRTSETEKLAAKRYPLPKVTRPRVVRDPECHKYEFSARSGGKLYYRRVGEDVAWRYVESGSFGVSAERVRVWNDLFANPTEEVEADE